MYPGAGMTGHLTVQPTGRCFAKREDLCWRGPHNMSKYRKLDNTTTITSYLMSNCSGSMLRINAEPSFFTEVFTELKAVGVHTEFRT